MVTLSKRVVVAVVVSAGCVPGAMAQTVVSSVKLTGVTINEATFDLPEARSFLFESILPDGTPVLEVLWGGPTGTVAGLAPRSAAIVRAGKIHLDLNVASLLRIDFLNEAPEPCVGTYTATIDDHATLLDATDFSGGSASLSFFPFSPSGGIQYRSHLSGHGSRGSANFSGTCAGATVVPSPGLPNARMATRTGNYTVVVTLFP